MDSTLLAILASAWLFGLITAAIAGRKDLKGVKWFALGALLGPIGILIVAFHASGGTPCQACGTPLKAGFYVCAACGKDNRG